jgi:lysozyme
MSGNIINMLIRHEGLELNPYRCPAGKLTIGVGRNIDDVGISRAEAIMLLRNDIERVKDELIQFHWFREMNRCRQDAMINMCFNLGLPRFLTFEKMLAALEFHNYDLAAKEMLDSRWAEQVGNRAVELAEIMRTGKWVDSMGKSESKTTGTATIIIGD